MRIALVSACDCTTVDYSSLPVEPGDAGQLDVVFDSTTKTEAETISLDIILENTMPQSGDPIIETLEYSFTIE